MRFRSRSCAIRAAPPWWRIDAQDRVCLLRQYRHAAGGYIYELPAGKLEPDEPPEVTTRRELAEEAGMQRRELAVARRLFQLARACSPRSSTCTWPRGSRRSRRDPKPTRSSKSSGGPWPRPWSARATGNSPTRRRSSEFCEPVHVKNKRETAHRPRFGTPEMLAMSNIWICAVVHTSIRGQTTIQTGNRLRPPTGGVCRRSCTTIVVTRAWNGSMPATPVNRSSVPRSASRPPRPAARTPS